MFVSFRDYRIVYVVLWHQTFVCISSIHTVGMNAHFSYHCKWFFTSVTSLLVNIYQSMFFSCRYDCKQISNFEINRLHTFYTLLTHWGRVTHICVGNLTITGSCNGLSPWRRQAITWTNAGISSIGPLATNFSEILIKIQTLSFKKMYLKISSAKWLLFCLGLNELTV